MSGVVRYSFRYNNTWPTVFYDCILHGLLFKRVIRVTVNSYRDRVCMILDEECHVTCPHWAFCFFARVEGLYTEEIETTED